jgi:5'(3')-deoxyribonucleotidase
MLNYKDVIVTSKKHLINCDFLIDDYEENLRHSNAVKILYDMPYNKTCDKITYDFRVTGPEDIYEIINKFRAASETQ